MLCRQQNGPITTSQLPIKVLSQSQDISAEHRLAYEIAKSHS